MKNSSRNYINRRRFLADCGKMTGIGAMSSMLSLQLTNKVMAARPAGSITDYKGLVCIFLFGGNDSYNMLAPGAAQYQDYINSRGILAKPIGDMIPILQDPLDSSSTVIHHLNGNLTGLNQMYLDEELAFVANVGTLVEPVSNVSNLRNVLLPYGLYSHNDQIEQWQVSYSESKTSPFAGTGWAGRILDILNDAANNNATASASLAPYGANLAQVGTSNAPFLTNGGVDSLDLYETDSLIRGGMDATLETQYASVMQAHHNYVRNDALDQSALLEGIEQDTVINTSFPDSSIGQQLLQIAKYIKSHGVSGLNANRQTFFAGQTAYDTHGGGILAHDSLMSTLNAALTAFNAALKEIGYHDQVVTYTASDFGRTLSPNSAGSDHGWGGNQMVMGGPVSGGQVFGNYPDIALGSNTDVGRGRQIPTTSVDELHASLARWFGVENDSEMEQVVPNIRRFWAAGENGYAIPNLFA